MLEVQTAIQTVADVMNMMAPFAGGSVPNSTDTEYGDWLRWIQQKQEEYARRGFWRRCLTRVEMDLDGETTLLPDRFHKPNGLYMVIADGVNWMDPENEDDMSIFVEYVTDPDSDDYAKWQMRFSEEITTTVEDAVVWYFANPPKPTASTDKLLLPADMIGYGALSEHYRTSGAEGSQDKAEQDAENRFQEYLMLEVIPSTNELLRMERDVNQTNYLNRMKTNYYSNRPYRRRR